MDINFISSDAVKAPHQSAYKIMALPCYTKPWPRVTIWWPNTETRICSPRHNNGLGLIRSGSGMRGTEQSPYVLFQVLKPGQTDGRLSYSSILSLNGRKARQIPARIIIYKLQVCCLPQSGYDNPGCSSHLPSELALSWWRLMSNS